MRPSLATTINEYKLDNHVILLGRRTDVPALLHQYDCFVFPSHSEGFSGALAEAMMSGLPVLASDIPANKEMIMHRQTGYLFEAGSVEGITNAMLWYSNNKSMASEMARHAHDHAVQYFELGIVAGKLEDYLHRLIHQNL
jgi:glycosyltransferase involved in cell wall biosynthesis